MKLVPRHILVLILAGNFCVGKAQYTGGIEDGHSVSSLILSACPPLANTNIYRGGNNDGYSSALLAVSSCPPPQNTNIYIGGNSDGYSTGAFIPSVCPPPPNTNIYSGGNADGYARGALTVTLCPPLPSTNIYYGGIEAGYARGAITVTICPPIANTNIYLGGNADGEAWGSFVTCVVILPIELLEFTGTCSDQTVLLKWASATETNNDHYTLEHGKDGSNWQAIGTLRGAGTSLSTHHYALTDENPYQQISYYRLKQTDIDGKSWYSSLIAVSCNESETDIKVHPNPNNGRFTVEGLEKNSDLIVTNPLGTGIYKTKVNLNRAEIDLSGQASGVYFLEIISVYKTSVKKIVVNK